MSIARGWQFFMHPGPTNIPHRVLQAMQRPAVDPKAVEERLAADKGHVIKAVLIVQNETATGTRHPRRYWDWRTMVEGGRQLRFCGTARSWGRRA